MTLPLQDFATLVKTQGTAISVACRQVVDITVGSVVRALLEANASIALWLQWLIVQVLAATRASTSTGADLDSWIADFGMTRLPATAAAGSVTFSRTTTGVSAVIPLGALVRTGFGRDDQIFAVVSDFSNPAWAGTSYVIGAPDTSVTVRVSAQQPGSAGNVLAGSVTILASAIPGVDAVTNSQSMAGGVDAETDVALRSRFAGFLDSRNRATAQAIGFAIASVMQGLSFTIAERADASGVTRPGHFTVTVDDGTGAPSPALLNQVATAIDAVRPIGGTFSVRPPLVIPVSIFMHAVGSASAIANCQSAIAAYISALSIGEALTVTRLYQIGYGSDPGITNVSQALINGINADLIPQAFGLLRPSTILVSA